MMEEAMGREAKLGWTVVGTAVLWTLSCGGPGNGVPEAPRNLLETEEKFVACLSQLNERSLGNLLQDQGICSFETTACEAETEVFPQNRSGVKRMELTSKEALAVGINLQDYQAGLGIRTADKYSILMKYTISEMRKARRTVKWLRCLWDLQESEKRVVDTLYYGELTAYVEMEAASGAKAGISDPIPSSAASVDASIMVEEGYVYKAASHVNGFFALDATKLVASPCDRWTKSGGKLSLPGHRCFRGDSLSQVVDKSGETSCVVERRACERSAFVGVAESFVAQCGLEVDVKETEGLSKQAEYVLKGRVEGLDEICDPKVSVRPGMDGVDCYQCESVWCVPEDKFEAVCKEMRARTIPQ